MKIKWLQGTDDLSEIFYIRKVVFVDEQRVPIEEEIDDLDYTSTHICIYDSDKAIGTARIIKKGEKTYFGRVAVLKQYRRKGIGKIIIQQLEQKCKEDGIQNVYLDAQVPVIDFYRNIQYKEISEEFMDAGIPHITMTKNLNNIGGYNG